MPSSSADMAGPRLDMPALRRALRRIFDRRAGAFEAAAFLPRELSSRMRERLDYIKIEPRRVLDAGCGTGADLANLATRFEGADIFGIDLSQRMSALASQAAHSGAGPRWVPARVRRMLGAAPVRVVQGEFGALPFARGVFDLIWSNFALHWHIAPDTVFPEWRRALRVGGLLMFSLLGPDSLKELRDAWAEVDPGHAHVLDFVDMHDIGDMLVASGFEAPVMDMEKLTVTYKTPAALLADVRRWGAYPPAGFATRDPGSQRPAARPAGLTGRARHRALLAALEARRGADGLIALSFEVIYGHAWTAALRTTAEGHGVVQLDDIGGRRVRER